VSEEEEDGAVPEAGTAGKEDEGNHQQEDEGDQQQEDQEGGDEVEVAVPAIWQRGPSRLPERPIPLERRPIIRPDGKR
jgi:hypothetical protein